MNGPASVRRGPGVWPVKTPDLSRDGWRAALEECLGECLAGGDRARTARRIEARWSGAGDALACLSVRSAFDRLLRAEGWEPGDEMIFTAVTVPDMPRIARIHGIRPVALDVDPVTAEPDAAELPRLVGPRTRALVHAHLFGGRADVGPLVAAAHRHGLLFVEDCAQCYGGPGWTGHEGADVALFSFGPWKTATALGGALARVRDPERRARMRALDREDPVQPPHEYLAAVLGSGALRLAGSPEVYRLFVDACRALGTDHRALVHRVTKGYRGPDFVRRIRRRPATPLLAVLERRLDEGYAPIRRRDAPARALLDALGPEVGVPGREQAGHTWWMMPVSVDDRVARFMAALLEEGFDTTRGRLHVVDGDVAHDAPGGTRGRGDPTPGARRLLRSTVFIPFGPEIPETELRRLGGVVRRALGLGSSAERP